jgi:hypothetical protein
MNQMIDWMQGNWYELGSLTAQFTFLFAGLWFAQKILKTMRASQQQFGALLRLSMTDGLEEPCKMSEAVREPVSAVSPAAVPSVVPGAMLSPVAERPAGPPTRGTSYAAFERPARSAAPSLSEESSGRANTPAPIAPTSSEPEPYEPTPESTPFVAAPLTLPEDDHGGNLIAAAGRGVVQWLQTPMASKSSESSPWRKIMRWLQAPARG